MNNKPVLVKKILIGGLITLITIMHFSVPGDSAALHVLHRELYFVPILLAAFWFGLNSGFAISLVSGFLYSSYILASSYDHAGIATVIPQALVFVLIGTMLGWLAEKRIKLHEKEIADNKIIILGRAASAVAHEMKDILSALQHMFTKSKGLHAKEANNDFKAELNRLSKMIDTLSSYAKKEQGRIFSNDLNNIIRQQVERFQKTATEKGVHLVTKLDTNGCPSWIDPGKIGWVLEKIIDNAMEVSSSNSSITIKSQRGGEYCSLHIKDDGPGIKPEHMKKIFSPFFTTKPNGQGLALAGCKKSIENMGGNVSVKSSLGKGSEFIILVPREYKGVPLAEDTANQVLRGQKDSQIYRE